MTQPVPPAPAAPPAVNRRAKVNPEANRQDILRVATEEFALHGLSGARVDEIARRTDCSKRLIYYYFTDKEGLYLKVLENSYQTIRSIERDVHFDEYPPIEAMTRLVEFRFDHHMNIEYFVRLIMIENIHNAQYLAKSSVVQDVNRQAVSVIQRIYDRGQREGLFRPGLDALHIHWQVSALSFFNVSNRATFSLLFRCDMAAPDTVQSLRRQAVESVLRYMQT